MANLYLIKQVDISNVDTVTVNHNGNTQFYGVKFVIDGEIHSEYIKDVVPDANDPLNTITIVFTQPVTGTVQVFKCNEARTPITNERLSALIAADVSPNNLPITQNDLLFGIEFAFAEDDKETLVKNTTHELQKLSLSVLPEGGRYRLEWYYETYFSFWRYGLVTKVKNGNDVLAETVTSFSRPSNGGKSWKGNGGHKILDLDKQPYTFEIIYALTHSKSVGGIRRARLSFWRVA